MPERRRVPPRSIASPSTSEPVAVVTACSPTRRQSSSRSTAARRARSAKSSWLVGITPTAGRSLASKRRSAQSSQGCQAAACRATREAGLAAR